MIISAGKILLKGSWATGMASRAPAGEDQPADQMLAGRAP